MLSAKARQARQSKRDATRERLLDAAQPLLLKHGLVGVSVEDLTTAAGLSRGAFYWSFDNKEQLALQLMERRAQRQLEDLPTHVAAADGARMSSFDQWIVRSMLAGREWFALEMEVLFIAGRSELGAALAVAYRRSMAEFEDVLAEHCQGLGIEASMPMAELARLTIGLANGLALQAHIDPDLDVATLLVAGVNRLLSADVLPPPETTVPAAAPRSRRSPATK